MLNNLKIETVVLWIGIFYIFYHHKNVNLFKFVNINNNLEFYY